jgi:histidine ammonia-lyase
MLEQLLEIDGSSLTLEKLHQVAYREAKVSIAPSALERVERGCQTLQRLVDKGTIIYGVNTGVGELASKTVDAELRAELQKRIIRSHCAGVGPAASQQHVRGAMLLRANCLLQGYSGVSPQIPRLLVDMLNAQIYPLVPEQGSLGASGDLAPLAHIALALIGEGEVIFQGRLRPAVEALKEVGLNPVALNNKDSLALINGSQFFTALGGLEVFRARKLLRLAIVSSALTMEALRSLLAPFQPQVHALRPFAGQKRVAEEILLLTSGSRILADQVNKVQDAYSIRCMPQVLGPVYDALDFASRQLEIEMNSVVDNPIFFPEQESLVTAGNFHGQPIAIILDYVAIALCSVGNLLERHINRLLNQNLSAGLPPFLAEKPGLNSGFMLAQYTAAALTSENKTLCSPASVDTIPVSADQEDHVSMGPNAAFKLRRFLDNLENIVAISLLCSAQAVDFRGKEKLGKGTEIARQVIRRVVPHWDEDRLLSADIEAVRRLVAGGELLAEVGDTVGWK